MQHPSTYLVSRLTYRELEDSTKKVMLYGDGALPPLIPPEAVREYRAGDNLVHLHGGSTILFRSLDEPGKLRNLTLGGAFVDQIEELDEGPDGERLLDTLIGRLSDPGGPRKLIAVSNPGPLTHFVYRRLVADRTRDTDARRVHFTLRDNAAHLPPDYIERMEATRATRPHWYRSFILGDWGAFEGAAYEGWDDSVHVLDPFVIPSHFERFESMDHGAASPTAWLAWATDEDANHLVFDLHYQANWLVSDHAAEILRRRAPKTPGAAPPGLNWWQRQEGGKWQRHYCYADPTISAGHGLSTRWGQPASVLTEYQEHGVDWVLAANRDRAAAYSRLLELIHVDPERPFPSWHPRRGEKGCPRLFVFRSCRELVEQIKSARVEDEGTEAGKAVSFKQESAHLHAHAALRYGAMSRPTPSPTPRPQTGDLTREEHITALWERYDKKILSAPRPRRYYHV